VPPPNEVIAYTDGATFRGNPGAAGIGVRIETMDGRLLEEISSSIGRATSNEAELRAAIEALTWAKARGVHSLTLRTDSRLVVMTLRGRWTVSAGNLIPLHRRARGLIKSIPTVKLEWVPREESKHADFLARQGARHGGRRS